MRCFDNSPVCASRQQGRNLLSRASLNPLKGRLELKESAGTSDYAEAPKINLTLCGRKFTVHSCRHLPVKGQAVHKRAELTLCG